jgi:hypothetical protein
VICQTVDSRLRTDNIANIAITQTHHRISRLFFSLSLLQYIAKNTITIHTNTARESVAHIHAVQITRARIDRSVFCFFLTLFVKNRQTNGKNATKKYQ